MRRSLDILRRMRTRWALLPGVLLLLALVTGSLHHHARDTGAHACAICTLSHAPAISVPPAVPHTNVLRAERVIVAPDSAPRSIRRAAHSSRAPPAA